MVGVDRVRDGEHGADRLGVGPVRVGGGTVVLADFDVALGVDQVHEEAAVGGVVRMKGEAEQALLATGGELGGGEIEEGGCRSAARVEDGDAAQVLLDDEQIVRPTGRRAGEHRPGQTAADAVGADAGDMPADRGGVGAPDHVIAAAAVDHVAAAGADKSIGASGAPHHGRKRNAATDRRRSKLRGIG